jgi:hypothetical protein
MMDVWLRFGLVVRSEKKPMELMGGIEPPTSSLPRMRSTPELHEQVSVSSPLSLRFQGFRQPTSFPRAVTKTPGSPGKAGRKVAKPTIVSKKIARESLFYQSLLK